MPAKTKVLAHTPGPWWLSGARTIRHTDATWIAQLSGVNREADAALIVAAPDLLHVARLAHKISQAPRVARLRLLEANAPLFLAAITKATGAQS